MRVCNLVRHSLTALASTTLAHPSKQALFGADAAKTDIAAHLSPAKGI
jgi:hypothetical protein